MSRTVFHHRAYVLAGVVFLCALPYLLNICGVSFSSFSADDLAPLANESVARGKAIHAILEWSAVSFAVLAGVISLLHFHANRNISVAIVGIAILFSGVVDGFHILMASGMVSAKAPADVTIPLTWAFSRIFVASALFISVAISLRFDHTFKNHRLSSAREMTIVVSAVVVMSSIVLVMIRYAATAENIPALIFENGIISRPFDVIPLAILACITALAGSWLRQTSSQLQFFIILCALPQIVAQIHMAFGSGELFGNDFNIAHGLKLFSYFIYSIGVVLDLIARGTDAENFSEPKKSVVSGVDIQQNRPFYEVGSPLVSMAVRLPIMTFIVSLVVAGVVGGVFYLDAEKLVTQRYVDELEIESKLIEPLLSEQFNRATSDVIFLSRTPPIQGIVKAIKNADESDHRLWVNRLQQIFREKLLSNHNYLQIQYIEVGSSYKEVVSAAQTARGVRVTPSAKLAVLEVDDYLVKIKDKNRGDVYLSALDDYRVAESEKSVMHVGTPIYDEDTGRLYGIVIIHVDLAIFVRQIMATTLSGYIFYLAKPDGEIIFLGHNGFVKRKSENDNKLQLLFPHLINNNSLSFNHGYSELTDSEDSHFSSYLQVIQLEQFGAEEPILFLLQKPRAVVDLQLAEFRNRSLLVGAALSILALAIAIFGSRRVTSEITAMSGAVQHYEVSGELTDIPVASKNEVGVLARSFSNLMTRMNDSLAEQKQLATHALETSSRLSSLVDNAVDAIITITPLGEILTFNQAAIKMFGYQEEEVIGKNVSCLMPMSHAGQHDQYINNYLRTGDTKIIGKGRELVATRKNGDEFQIHLGVSRVESHDGLIFSGIIRDISDSKRMENDREESLSILEAILNSTENGVLVTSKANEVVNLNTRFSEMWEMPKVIAESCDINSIFKFILSALKDPTVFSKIIQQLNRGDDDIQGQIFEMKNGCIISCASRIVQVDGFAIGRIWSVSDVTQSKVIEKTLIKARDDAEQIAKYKSEFLASMSHEIRTPMNGVVGMLNLLMQSELDSKQQRRAGLAKTSAESLLTIINDILDFSKVEAGKLELEKIDFDLIGLLGDFAESMAIRAQEKKLELVLDVSGITQSQVKGDPDRIRQILNNLVGNSIKFTAKGDVVIRAELQEQSDSRLLMRCTVADTGIGIPPDKITTIFESFTQVDASTTRQYGGTGLGLTIVKQLCDIMGGSVSARSEFGVGSQFEFSLLLDSVANEHTSLPTINLSELNILIVDDSAANRHALKAQLALWGARVTEAASGQQALKALALGEENQEQFHIVFLDMDVPSADGVAFSVVMRQDPRFENIKIVLMLPPGNKVEQDHFARVGCDAQFAKPATMSDLFDALITVVPTDSNAHTLYPEGGFTNFRRRQSVDLTSQTWPRATRILLVEDNRVNQEVARGMLEEFGLSCDIAENGYEALLTLKKAPLDAPYTLILMDCQMPEMDGYEATRQIRAGGGGDHNSPIPVLAMTANAMKGDKEKCLAAGMNDYLSKPINFRHLLVKLQALLSPNEFESETKVAELEIASTSFEDANEELSLLNSRNYSRAHEASSSEQKEDETNWDLPGALDRVRGKPERLATLLDMFLADMPDRFEQLGVAIQGKDFDQVSRLAHTIKGVTGNLSANRLMHSAAQLEELSMAEDDAAIQACWPNIYSEYCQLETIFKAHLGSRLQ